jgi:hypothetical protein
MKGRKAKSEGKMHQSYTSQYYKHLKKVLNKAIWSDKKWAGFWQILILNLQVDLECFFAQKICKLKVITHDLVFY